MNDFDSVSPLQKKLLEMFEWFHNYCEEHGLKYFCLGGTMLGAVRHNGFIPWDDDIDVGLPREDYERLKVISKTDKSSKYQFEFPDSSSEDFATPYAKLYDVSTTLIEDYQIPLKRGVFIDVFPLDGTGNNKIQSQLYYLPIRLGYYLLLTKTVTYSSDRSTLKNASILLANKVFRDIISTKRLRQALDAFGASKTYSRCNYGGNLFGNWGSNEIMELAIYGTPTKYTFNNLTVYGVEQYDKYLSNLYGDWNKLPPIEKRVSHHSYLVLDLNNPYI